MTIDSIRASHFNNYPTNHTTRNGPVGSEEQSAAKGELPATQVFPAAEDEKAANEHSPDTDKAKQQAANNAMAAHAKEDSDASTTQKAVKKPGDDKPEAIAKDGNERQDDGDGDEGTDTRQAKVDAGTPKNARKLSEEDLRRVQELANRDREVHVHESAHLAVAGEYALGAASFSYETGPDGKRYAVGGEVNIDTAPVPDDPQATLQKADAIRAAALAPSEPSGQDRNVAVEAMHMAAQARSEILAEKFRGSEETSKAEQTDLSDEANEADATKQADSTGTAEGGNKSQSKRNGETQDVKVTAEGEGAAQKYTQVANNAKGHEAEQPALDLLA